MRFLHFALVLPLVVLAATEVASTIRFADITESSGLRFVTDSCFTPQKNQPETMVSGIAFIDYDRDGYPDLYFVNGAAIPSLKKEDPKYYNRLFHNNGNGTFADVTEKAGVAGDGYGMGAAVGDFDNDGWPDLYVVNVTRNQLLRNNGNGTFTDITDKAGVAGGIRDGKKMWSVAAGWFDYNRDGLLDLFVGNYCKWEVNKDPVCGPRPGVRAYCHPNNYAPLPNQLYRNNGNGTFTDVSTDVGLSKHLGKGMGVAFGDYDRDGFIDVFVANDNHPNFLFHNLGGKRFEEVALEAGVAYTENGTVVSGMGAEFRDVNNDGFPDIWHTAIENETFPLFQNRGDGLFIEVTGPSGLGRTTRAMSGWSNAMVDLDNDGWKDLVVARGNVLDNIAELGSRKFEEPNTIFRNVGKAKFEDVTAAAGAGLQPVAPHRGIAYGDLDNDGRIDLVFTALSKPARVLRNVSENGNHWITLKLTGTKSNRMGLGAEISVTAEDGTKQYDMASTSTGFACSSDERVHFGLGASKAAKQIEIRWPSGVKQMLKDVVGDRIVAVEEPK